MARLVYSAIASLDGYVADQEGGWDWSVPDAQVPKGKKLGVTISHGACRKGSC